MSTNGKSDRAKTTYQVLRLSRPAPKVTSDNASANAPLGDLWEAVGKPVEAANSAEAVRKAAGEASGTYLAVPARSFVPVKVTVEQKTVVKLT